MYLDNFFFGGRNEVIMEFSHFFLQNMCLGATTPFTHATPSFFKARRQLWRYTPLSPSLRINIPVFCRYFFLFTLPNIPVSPFIEKKKTDGHSRISMIALFPIAISFSETSLTRYDPSLMDCYCFSSSFHVRFLLHFFV